MDLHEHPTRTELVVILRGRAHVRGVREGRSDPLSRKEELGPGNLVLAPPGAAHAFTNAGDAPLWSLVLMSPPVKGNVYLDGAPPRSPLDFLVLPLRAGETPRGAFVPAWARHGGAAAWSGTLDAFPGIPGRLLRDPRRIAHGGDGGEAWVVLLRGAGRLAVGETVQRVRAPTWITAPDGRFAIEGDGAELVVLAFWLPRFDARLFVRWTLERYGAPEGWVPAVDRLFGIGPWGGPGGPHLEIETGR